MFSDKIKIIMMIIGILIIISGLFTLFNNSEQANTAIDQTSDNEQKENESENIELERNTLLNGKLSILIPKSFNIMTDEEIKQANPNIENVPIIYANKEGTVNIIFTYTTDQVTEEDITTLKDEIANNIDQIHPLAKLIEESLTDINGKVIGIVEIITPGKYTEVYSLILFTDLEERLLTINISLPKDQIGQWKPIIDQIINSLEVNE
ncbi:hypothetical protein BHF71_08500 [Vulcanibacillus modesticaldus]|uniref:PsbP C-terminal domain-containing protein n=1 Tax=Vulcanibacillus modesticaldus TaxID=337097 RepID=A0A1D2YV65_9BACI|nr:hypothetical protein [Vulcanibacillus modesticaldus]OEF99577.1 hypothetical protein BHF71_08500 [Vulcanibacillus modesticaldus]